MVKDRKYLVVSTFLSFDDFEEILQTIEAQTIQPTCWYLYNDSKKPFVPRQSRFPIHMIDAVPNNMWYYKRHGFNVDYLYKVMDQKDFDEVDYILNIDDDTLLPKDYVERLIPFLRDGAYGAVSGKLLSWNGVEWVYENRVSDFAIGAAQFYRKEVIEYWKKGYPVQPAGDTVLNLTANVLGFKTMQIDNVVFWQKRLTYVNSGLGKVVCMAVKRYYLRFPYLVVVGLLIWNSKWKAVPNLLEFWKLTKEVKEEDRLNDFDIVKANNRRLLLIVLKKFRKIASRWF